MKEIPMIYSTPMVQAVQDDRKTKTRRTTGLDKINENPEDWIISWIGPTLVKNKKEFFGVMFEHKISNEILFIKCPYGQPGDLLYVRESFQHIFEANNSRNAWVIYKADNGYEKIKKWKPSIHMPKAAARIWLRVTDIHVERLHDITEQDAIAEGIEYQNDLNGIWYKNYNDDDHELTSDPIDSFQSLWISINGSESWDLNPFVWVVSFELVSKNGKPVQQATLEPYFDTDDEDTFQPCDNCDLPDACADHGCAIKSGVRKFIP